MKKIKTLVHNILLIKEGETTPLIHFWFIFMLTLGAGLAVGRASSDTLFLTRYGIEYLPLIYMALAPLLAVVSIAYAAIVDSVSSEKFFSFILTGLIFAVFLSWLMMSQTNSSFIYPFYFIVHKIASELLVVHGSLYLIHNFNTLQAKRLFPIIFTGEQLGCILGGFLVSGSVSVLDTENLPLLWILLMLAGILQLKYWHSRRGTSPYFQSDKKPGSKLKVAVQSVYQGLSFTRESSLLRYASFALFFLVIIYYILSYSTNRIFVDTFKNEDDLARFLGLLTVGTSSITLLLQLFVTNRIIRRFGVKKLNLVFPAAIASAALGLLVSFTLTFAIIASVVRDSLLNSLQNPLRIIFFNALPSFMQGRAGAVSIAVVMPAALLVCGLLLWQIQSLNNVVYFVAPCVLLAFAFFYYCYKMNKTYTDTLTSNLKNRLYLPDNNLKNTHIELDDSTLQSIKNTFDELPQARAITLSLLVSHYPEKSIDFIASKLKELPASETDVFLHLLFNKLGGSLPYDIIKKFPLKDSHIKTTLLILLADNNYPEAVTLAEKNIDTSSVRVKAAISYSFLKDSNQKNYNAAIEIWSHLLNGDKHSQIATLILLPLLKNIKENDYIVLAAKTKKTIDSILNDEDMDLVGRTLKQLPLELTFINHNTIERCVNLLINQTNPHFRENAVFGLKFLSEEARYRVIYDLLNDSHTSVRQNTLLNIDLEKRDKETLINQWLINGKSSPRIQSTILEYIINNEVFSHNVLSTLALNKATNACDYSVAISIINNDSNDLDINENLVLLILNERKIQMIDLALQALTPLCAKDQITVIRAGLVSKNEQHIANASEILNNIDNQPSTEIIEQLLQNNLSIISKNIATIKLENKNDVLQWASKSTDHWVSYIANIARGTTMVENNSRNLIERINLLKKTDIFSSVPTDDLLFVAKELEEVKFFKGERVFDINDMGDRMYIIVDGNIGISISPSPSSTDFIVKLKSGSSFGEMNLLDNLPRSATAHVLEDTYLLTLEKNNLIGLLKSYPDLSLGILRALSFKVRENHQRHNKLKNLEN